MNRAGKLKLQLVDVYGDPLAERVDISLRHQTLDEKLLVRSADARRKIQIGNLRAVPQGLYRIEVDPPSYLPVSRFINIQPSGITERVLTFPIEPSKVLRVSFPHFGNLSAEVRRILDSSSAVLGYEGSKGKDLYSALDDIRRAGLLNIVAKCFRTRIAANTVLDYMRELLELRGDRFFARVPKELREDVKNSVAEGLFAEVSGLAHRPPDGYSLAGSYKTPDPYGNLQLTFFASPAGDWVADIDIDDANGLEHSFQVLRNWISNRPTHPYDIHQILVHTQELDPGYRFVLFDTPAKTRAATEA